MENQFLFGQLYSTTQTSLMLPSILRLKIANKLLECPKTCAELSQNTSIIPDRLHRILSHLENSGFFSFDASTEKWSNNANSASLADPHTSAMIFHLFSKILLQPYMIADQIICSESDGFQLLGLKPAFEEFQNDAELLSNFQTVMQIMTKSNLPQVIEGIDLENSSKILDVGGGDGTLVIGLAEKHKDKRFAVFERAEVAEIARKNIEAHGVLDRIEVINGNFFERVTVGFDAILMKHIVHDWSDEKTEAILINCRSALQVGNKLVILELINNRGEPDYPRTASIDIHMMTAVNGKERSRAEFEELFGKTGFRLEKIADAGIDMVIMCVAV